MGGDWFDSRTFRRIARKARRIKTWQLVIVLVLVGFVTATFLRLNNVGMSSRREAVLAADREGRDEDMWNRMYDLQRYSSSHMNASTGQFDLKEQYRRDVQKAIADASNDANPNGNVTAQVEAICDPKFSTWSPAYVQCFTEELNKFPSAPELDDRVVLPSPALYRHSFASPLWSPDFAGFSLLLFLLIAAIVVIRLAYRLVLYLVLKYRFGNLFG